MDDDLFLSEQHPLSKRWAVVEDDGEAVWLYLTLPNTSKPETACWLYNSTSKASQDDEQFLPPPTETAFFRWSADGSSVAVLFGSEVFGFISNASASYSRLLRFASSHGNPIDMELYSDVFGKAT